MKTSFKKLIFVLVVMAMIATLAFALVACGDKEAQTQTTPPTGDVGTGGDTPSTGGDTTHVHAYGSWSITRSATCSREGLKTRRCVTCGNVDTETIPKTAHTPVTDDAIEATCTQEGKTQGSHCGVCGTVIVAQTKVDKKEHTIVIDQAIPATCTEPGKTQGSHCDVCKTVLQEQQETRALGHTAGAEWCSNDDTHWHECIRCHTHMDEVSHTYGNWQTQSTPTIDAEGIDRQYCTCGKYHERKVDKLPPFTFVMDGTVYSVKAYLGHDSVVEVPSTYNGVTVAVIGSYAFQYQTGITDIILPETILKIDYGAFSYCTSLQNVDIPKCMTFGDFAFDNCTSLKEIVMPDNLTSCGLHIFDNCTALTKVTFTGGMVSDVLQNNKTVQEIIVEDGVKIVARHAFTGCTSLKYLTLPRIESSATSFAEYYLGVTPQTYTYSYNGIDAYTDRDLIEPAAVDTYTMNGRVFGIPRSGCDWYVNSRYLGTVTNGGITYTYTDKPIKVSKWYNWYDISVQKYYNIPQTWTAEYSYLPNTPIDKLTVTNQMISRYDSVFDNCTCKLDIWQKFPIKQLSVTGNSSPFVDEFNEEDYTLVAEHTDSYVERLPLFDYIDEDDKAIAGELGQHQLTVTYQDASIEYALEILLHQFDDAVFNSHEFIFDGETKYMSVDMFTGLPEGTDVVFDGDGQSELGHYEVTATLSKQYYESKTLTATMDIFPPTFSLTYVLGIDEATHENPSDYQTNGDGVELAAATLAGFGFVDWYTEPEFTNKITKIEGNAHQDYTLYAKWQLPFDITDGSIKVNAFGKKQTEIIIPNRVYDQTITAIASEAFKGCTSLQAVTIGDGVTSIGVDAFKNCTGINKVNYLGTLKGWCEFLLDNASTNPMSAIGGAKLYLNDEEVTEVKDLDGLESIPAYAFYYCTGITSVTIPDSVTNIGVRAFYYCTNLQTVTIGNGVQSIGNYAFYYCTGLQSLTIGKGVESIGDHAFYGCKGLSEITIPDSVQSIGSSAFSGCSNLKAISVDAGNAIYQSKDGIVYKSDDKSIYIVPEAIEGEVAILDGCNIISSSAFDGCNGLTAVTIPDSVTSIGSYAFEDCTGLQTVTIGEGVQSIGGSAFYGCTVLSEITIPDSVQSIGNYAFYDCTGLQTVTIGSGVQSIGDYACSGCTGLQTVNWNATNCTKAGKYEYYIFKGCTQLTTLNIGQNVQSLPAYAFYGRTSITKVNYLGNLKGWCEIEFKNSYANPLSVTGGKAQLYCNGEIVDLTNINIPVGTTKVGSYSFYGLKGITSVTIPDSVQSIGNYAFYDCTGLSEITIPDSVTSIGNYAFYDCTGLQTVAIGEGVQSICEYAFYGCTGLSEITIPDSVASISNYAFRGCAGLQTAIINAQSIDNYAFNGCTNLQTVTIGNGVTSIGEYAFGGCGNLKSISVEEGNATYQSKDSIVYKSVDISIYIVPAAIEGEVTILDGCAEIKNSVFDSRNRLTAITISDSVQSIGSSAFSFCTGLRMITIGEGVQCIDNNAFDNCRGLQTINWNAINCTKVGNTIFKDCLILRTIIIGESVQLIPAYAFYYCTGLSEITFPNSVQSIGSHAFYYCTGLSEITIPDSVTSIGSWAFEYCTGLQTVTIPDSVTSIGDYAFYGCTGMQTATINAKSIGDETFVSCTGLQTVTIGEGVQSIGDRAFSGCTGLKDITIPEGVQSIGEDAFFCCKGMQTATINAKSIGDNAFYNCTGLQTVTIGEGVQSIGKTAFGYCSDLQTVNWNTINCTCAGDSGYKKYIFADCTKLTKINIGSSVQSIPAYAFYGCTGIYSISIPVNVQRIGDYAFFDCTGLRHLFYAADETQWGHISKGEHWDDYQDNVYTYTINYKMHYNSTVFASASAVSNISALPSDQPVLIACDKLDLWVKQD